MKVLGWGTGLLLGVFALFLTFQHVKNEGRLEERVKWTQVVAKAADKQHKAELKLQQNVSSGLEAHIKKEQDARPIIERSYQTVIQYAKTPEGNRTCLTSDRVQSIKDTAAQLRVVPSQPSIDLEGSLFVDPASHQP